MRTLLLIILASPVVAAPLPVELRKESKPRFPLELTSQASEAIAVDNWIPLTNNEPMRWKSNSERYTLYFRFPNGLPGQVLTCDDPDCEMCHRRVYVQSGR